MLETPRLQLSIITTDDVDAVFQTLNDQHTCEIISFLKWPLTREQAEWWCAKAVTGEVTGSEYLFIARLDDKPVGCVGLHIEDDNCAEIGYWVEKDMQGQGIATEMLVAVAAFGLEQLKLNEIYATTAKGNPASDAVLMKNGFVPSGSKDVPLPDGALRPSSMFVLKRAP
ncbi:MAG: GNAT family N-acetyltransferase [Alphaproteobacteria bacterium]|nr:GNAT family N-acetyltransferase [Alphaproteobacteria bacterium]